MLCLGTLTGSKYIFVYALQRGTAVSVGCVYWLGRQRWCHVAVVMDGWIDGWGFYTLSMLLRYVCVCVGGGGSIVVSLSRGLLGPP